LRASKRQEQEQQAGAGKKIAANIMIVRRDFLSCSCLLLLLLSVLNSRIANPA